MTRRSWWRRLALRLRHGPQRRGCQSPTAPGHRTRCAHRRHRHPQDGPCRVLMCGCPGWSPPW